MIKTVLEFEASEESLARFVKPYPFFLAEGSENAEMAEAFARQSTAQGWPVTFIEPTQDAHGWLYPELRFFKRPDGFISYEVLSWIALTVAPEELGYFGKPLAETASPLETPEAEKTDGKAKAKAEG